MNDTEVEALKKRVQELEALLALAQEQIIETNKEITLLAEIIGAGGPDADS